jgi:hypothetical protein
MSLCPVDHKACQCSGTAEDPCPQVETLRAENAAMRAALSESLPYMREHGQRLANDYRPNTADSTRAEGERLIARAAELDTARVVGDKT